MNYSSDYDSNLSESRHDDSLESYSTIGSGTIQDTAEQITNLQTEILNQALLIDRYISEGARKGNNTETFHQLQDLYKLFKAELNLNFTIRKALIQERSTSEKVATTCSKSISELNDFFSKLSLVTGVEVHNLDTAVKLIENAIRNGLFTHKKQIIRENKQLQQKINELQDQINEIQAQKALEFAEIQAKIDIAESNAQKYQKEIEDLQKAHNEDSETIKTLISQKQNEVEDLSSKFKFQQYTKMNEYYEIKRKYEELTKESATLREDVNKLKAELEKVTQERDSLSNKAKDADEYSMALQKLENDMKSKEEETKRLKREKNALAKCVNESKTIRQAYINKIDELQNRLVNIERKARNVNSNLDSENLRLKNNLRSAANEIRRLEMENSRLSSDSSLIRGQESILNAFSELKRSLHIQEQTSPMEVVRIILSNLNNNSKHSSDFGIAESDTISKCSSITSLPPSIGRKSSNGMALQEQIDALQCEVMSFKGEVNKYTQ
ncbi:hypothetical protein TVAG_353750 [Trichomonas vaginalis G3]|uniref:Uncharacterized protein n=1 Tax=Trichomonas vaginalis (strain ATCC PRA-98 / G3) TaxID=412133 RepID=A2FDG8_TRIV3|nr:biological adhesion protein [Trichomonas vaginalis G3]EAX97045.1 hypothetical protein TVAG_353750 [Trichomonas vaginalis G3]KAI5515721.1 biological adhesion protein [Trichomonas vaginalis G3]|eukprot:XP_001309975.1 hypothetical protein [Trichomonas vaginalis G3]